MSKSRNHHTVTIVTRLVKTQQQRNMIKEYLEKHVSKERLSQLMNWLDKKIPTQTQGSNALRKVVDEPLNDVEVRVLNVLLKQPGLRFTYRNLNLDPLFTSCKIVEFELNRLILYRLCELIKVKGSDNKFVSDLVLNAPRHLVLKNKPETESSDQLPSLVSVNKSGVIIEKDGVAPVVAQVKNDRNEEKANPKKRKRKDEVSMSDSLDDSTASKKLKTTSSIPATITTTSTTTSTAMTGSLSTYAEMITTLLACGQGQTIRPICTLYNPKILSPLYTTPNSITEGLSFAQDAGDDLVCQAQSNDDEGIENHLNNIYGFRP